MAGVPEQGEQRSLGRRVVRLDEEDRLPTIGVASTHVLVEPTADQLDK